jgi:serine/threonine protein kinase
LIHSVRHDLRSEAEPEQWPPKPPDIYALDVLVESPPFAVSSNAQLYKVKDRAMVCKSRGTQREYDIMRAAGDCSVKSYGRCLVRPPSGEVIMTGFLMDLETPLDPKKVDPSQRPMLMEKMIQVVLKLHRKGIIHGDIKPANMLICSDGEVRLCDFAEARFSDEDPDEWDGITTVNYMSPKRCRNWPDSGDPPPTVEDDLYGLGLSIWELYTGKIPFEDVYMDDIMDTVKEGATVDVDEVSEASVREVIRKFLRCGGAKV